MKSSFSLDKLLNKKAKDYSFIIGFFLIFSFFVVFVIRPNIVTVFDLQNQLSTLQRLDKDYEQAIFNIVTIQSTLERNRESLPLIGQALPSTPQINQVLDDVRKMASESGVELKKIEVGQLSLKESKNKVAVKPYIMNMETNTEFLQVNKFLQTLLTQRRLKVIKNISIVKSDKESTASSQLQIKLELESYYL